MVEFFVTTILILSAALSPAPAASSPVKAAVGWGTEKETAKVPGR